MNPFHIWLGLPEASTNPNHYQLLGLKSSERDPKIIEKAANQRLRQLEKVSPTEAQADSLRKIKQRVVKAHKILTDSVDRAEYDKKLKAQLKLRRTQKRADSSSELSTADPVSVPDPDEILQSKSASEPQEQLIEAQKRNVSASSDPSLELTSIPMAIPIQDLSVSKDQSAEETPAAGLLQEFSLANSASTQDEISVKPARYRRKSRSYFVPILGLVLCLGGIFGLVYAVTNFEKIKASFASNDNNSNHVPAATLLPETSRAEKSKNEAHSSGNTVPPIAIPDDLPTQLGDTTASPARPDSSHGNTQANVIFEALEFDELVRLRRHLRKAHNAMYRRDSILAKNEIKNAKSLLARFESDNGIQIVAEQQVLLEAANTYSDIEKFLGGFWGQVVNSSVQISGGQAIRVGEHEMGFVEGTDQFAVLRIDGTNVTYSYEFLPPGIAVVLGEQGAKKDVPTWRMQKAAFLALHRDEGNYGNMALGLARKAEEDNHDPTSVIKFLAGYDLVNFGTHPEVADMPARDLIEARIPDMMVELGIENLDKLRPDQAAAILDSVQEAPIIEKELVDKAVAFEIAYQLAIKTGNVRKAMDLLFEYGLWFDIGTVTRELQCLNDIVIKDLDERRARFLIAQIIESSQQIENRTVRKKLVDKAKRAAKKFGLNRLAKQLNSN